MASKRIKSNVWNIQRGYKYVHNISIVRQLQEESARSPTPTRRAEMSDGYQWLEHVVSMKIPARGEWFAARENSFTTQGYVVKSAATAKNRSSRK